MPNIPVVNAGLEYINGLNLAYATIATATVAAGQARNSTNVNDITLSAAATIDTAVTGANGLDTGTIANSTFYAVFIMGSSTAKASTAAMLSTSATAPSMPRDYDMFRRIGYVLTNGSAEILSFQQDGNSFDRTMWYDTNISELANGTATTFADIDLATSVPSIATTVILSAALTPNSAGNQAKFRTNGSSSTNGSAQISGDAAAVESYRQVSVPCDSSAIIEYLVENGSDSLDVYVAGYIDTL